MIATGASSFVLAVMTLSGCATDHATSSDAPSRAEVTILDLEVSTDRGFGFPAAPDRVNARWTVRVVAPEARASLVSATLTLADGVFVQQLTVDDPDILLTGGSGQRAQMKTSGSPPLGGDLVGRVCGNATATLSLTFLVGEELVEVSATTFNACAS